MSDILQRWETVGMKSERLVMMGKVGIVYIGTG